MARILVLFGSNSDHQTSLPLVEALKFDQHQVDFQVLSAHRHPKELQQYLETHKHEIDCIIAGAGLSAHLPGVVASKVTVPVFGLPVESMFAGLDAFLSILQMPTGVPVLSSAPGAWQEIVQFINTWSAGQKTKTVKRSVNIVVDPVYLNYEFVAQEIEKAKTLSAELKIDLKINANTNEGEKDFALILVGEEKDVRPEYLGIHIPMLDRQMRSSPVRALQVLDSAKRGGLWCGVNNLRNALIFFDKLLTMQTEQRINAQTHVGAQTNAN